MAEFNFSLNRDQLAQLPPANRFENVSVKLQLKISETISICLTNTYNKKYNNTVTFYVAVFHVGEIRV